jgi:hypothetical protein
LNGGGSKIGRREGLRTGTCRRTLKVRRNLANLRRDVQLLSEVYMSLLRTL